MRGTAVAVSEVVATDGGLKVGDTIRARMADTRPATLTVAAIHRRATGLGDLVLDPALARRRDPGATADAVLVAGPPPCSIAMPPRTPARARWAGPSTSPASTSCWRTTAPGGVWLIIGMSLAFTVLALVGVPHGVRGIPLVVPTVLTGGLLAGAAILALAAGGVTGRLALRVGPGAAMRGPE